MKKIIIVSDSLRIGGIQTALKNLLNHLDYSKYNVSLFLFDDSISCDNKNVNMIKSNFLLRIISLTLSDAKKRGYFIYLLRGFLSLLCKIFGANLVYSLIFFFMKKKKGYDIAISFSNNGNIKSTYFGYNKFVLSKIEANKKISWLHVDYEKMNMNNKINNREYENFDNIITVSKATKNKFLKFNPKLSNKTLIIYNYLNYKYILDKSSEKINFNFNKNVFNIICVARLDNNKNQIMQLRTIKKLKDLRLNFNWYFIGDGPDRYLLENYIKENSLEKNVKLLGCIENCFPYIKNVDLLVSTAKSESYGLTLAESLVLNTPVVALYYEAVTEIITKNNGIICYNEDEFFDKIKTLISDNHEYAKLKENSLINDYDDIISKEISKLFS